MINDNIIIINTDNCSIPEEGNNIYEARKNVAMLSNDDVLVSILVIAYNRLEKTRNCIESILEYTSNIKYELVLVDNGSNDGTLEYFESIELEKKKIIKITKNLQLSFGILQGTKYCVGRYIAFLNNDMIVTTNWLSNILKCFSSDERIGMICTDSSNVSNLQAADISFNNLDEMQQKAKVYNVSDPRKWHERLRLITLGTVYKRECIEICGNWDYGFFHDFSDDDLTFHIRRAGYKTILCKDVFVHHDHNFNSLDIEAGIRYNQSLEKGRENFRKKYFGIDAWDDSNNYETNMLLMLKPPIDTSVNVLGIDVKCGAPILEIKNKLKMYDVFDTCLSSFTENAKYYIDLKTISEGLVECDRIEYISEHFDLGSFDYILLGKPINLYSEPLKTLIDVLKLIKSSGQVLLKLRNVYDVRALANIFGDVASFDNDYPVNWTLDDLQNWVIKLGFNIENIILEGYNSDENTMNVLKQFCEKNNIDENSKSRLLTKNYLISITR